MGFAQFIHSPEFEGKEKHVPEIMLSETSIGVVVTMVTIKVGREGLHPTTQEHHIEWVHVFGETQDGKFVQIGTLNFGKGTSLPVGSLTIKKEDYTSLTAVVYCNLHGVWENSVTI